MKTSLLLILLGLLFNYTDSIAQQNIDCVNLEKQYKLEEAIECYKDEAKRTNTNLDKIYSKISHLYQRTSNIQQAIYFSSLSIQENEKNFEVYLGRAYSYYHLGDFKKAEQDYLNSLYLNPNNSRAIIGLVQCSVAKEIQSKSPIGRKLDAKGELIDMGLKISAYGSILKVDDAIFNILHSGKRKSCMDLDSQMKDNDRTGLKFFEFFCDYDY